MIRPLNQYGNWLKAISSTIVVTTLLSSIVGCNRGVDLGSVEGRVTDSQGKPREDLWIHFKPIEGRPAEGRTNGDGHYELRYSMNDKGALVGRHEVIVYSGGETDSRDNQLSPRVEVFRKEVEVQDGPNKIDLVVE